MHAYEIITKKRDGKTLSHEELEYFVAGLTSGAIPDYQVSAFAMAVYFKGMSTGELADFTMAMVNSGDKIDLSGISGIKVDKHSTGGVGDKTTILLAPWVAAANAPIAKMSGRGLGHTGGTVDKLESIPGFNPSMSIEAFINAVNSIGVAVTGQTGNLVPADKKLYAIRDVTGTVESIPLIASSVMSKKIAAGADAIVLDVKIGSGAFMKTLVEGQNLARAMVAIGSAVGRKTVAVLSNMDQPLGYAIGNSLEIIESIETLKGNGPKDVEGLAVSLGAQMLRLSGRAQSIEDGSELMYDALNSGKALEKLREMIIQQSGDPRVVDDYGLLPKAALCEDIIANESGYISAINAEEIGIAVKIIGAGRETKDDILDLSAGAVLKVKVGGRVNKGDKLAALYANDAKKLNEAKKRVLNAYTFSKNQPKTMPMVLDIIGAEDI